jgi:hypothetical protein
MIHSVFIAYVSFDMRLFCLTFKIVISSFEKEIENKHELHSSSFSCMFNKDERERERENSVRLSIVQHMMFFVVECCDNIILDDISNEKRPRRLF